MNSQTTQIQCPNCKSPLQAQIHQLVDPRIDPAAKSHLLAGTLNRILCPVCGYQGQLATPLVYHDAQKELLLSYMPVELAIPKDEQERVLGRLINRVIDRLPAEDRKGYLLQPQAVLTMQGLIERVLEADGVTKEDLESQRAKVRLFEELLRIPEEEIESFTKQHDEDLDAIFFQLTSLGLGATQDETARQAGLQRVERALRLSSYGKRLQAREAELRAAAESLQEAGESITREQLLDLLMRAPNDDRVNALVSLTRPGLDYAFFQALSEKIDKAEGAEEERLTVLRSRILELTEEIDRAQEARTARAAGLLRSLLEVPDLDAALKAALPMVDELFLSILQANLRAASESGDEETRDKLAEIDRRLQKTIYDSLPPGLQLAQRLLEADDDESAHQILEDSADQVDESTLGALLATAQRLEGIKDEEGAHRLRELHRKALRHSMRAKMKGEAESTPPVPSA